MQVLLVSCPINLTSIPIQGMHCGAGSRSLDPPDILVERVRTWAVFVIMPMQ